MQYRLDLGKINLLLIKRDLNSKKQRQKLKHFPYVSPFPMFNFIPSFLTPLPPLPGSSGGIRSRGLWSDHNTLSLPFLYFPLLQHRPSHWAAVLQELLLCGSSPSGTVPLGNTHLVQCGILHGLQEFLLQLLLPILILWPWNSQGFCLPHTVRQWFLLS